MDPHFPKRPGALLAGILACCAPAWPQTPGAIGGYTLGFVFDGRSAGLKPLVGIPGAAVLAAQLDAGMPIRKAYISPRQNFAVAVTDGDAAIVSFASSSEPIRVAPLGFDPSGAGAMAFSPDGSSGAFYNVNDAVIRVVTGLPGAPAVTRSIPAAAVPGTIRLLAVSNDGAQVAAGTDTPGASAASLLDADGNARTLASSTHVAAMQFIGDSKDLLVADDADDTVSVVQDVPGSAVPKLLAGAADGIAGPVGIDVSLDGKLVIVANGRAHNLLVFDPSGSQRDTYTCSCTPTGLSRLNGNSVFLLNGISDNGPLWLFDGDSGPPRTLFVPAGDSGPAGSDQ